MQTVRDFWASLDSTGRIVAIVCVAALLGFALYLGVDLTWVPRFLVGG